MNRNEPLLSACVLSFNEEAHIGRCLSSLEGLADEVVLVDSGSTDRTLEIAQEFAFVRVIEEPWVDDFAHHRNIALDAARGRFCLTIDCDEEIVNTDKEETRRNLTEVIVPELLMVREMLRYPDGREITLVVPRVVRRDTGLRYIHAIHEQLNVDDCTALLSNIYILHHGYTDPEELRSKEDRNLRIALNMPDSPHAFHCRARAAMTLERWEILQQSCLQLMHCNAPPTVKFEAAIMGGVSAFNSQRLDEFQRFLREARSIDQNNPDVRYLELLQSCHAYVESLSELGDSASPGEFIRPWTFWHERGYAIKLLETIAGRRKLA